MFVLVAPCRASAELGSKRKRMSLLSSGSALERAGARRADRRDRDLLVLEARRALSSACERLQAREPVGVDRVLDEIAAVGVARPTGRCRRSCRPRRSPPRRTRGSPAGSRGGRLASSSRVSSRRPLERAADDVEVRVGLMIAHHAVAFEEPVHEAGDDLRVLLGEAPVHDQHVGDDEQVAVRGEHVRLAAALLDDLRDLRLPRDAAGEAVLARLQVARGTDRRPRSRLPCRRG